MGPQPHYVIPLADVDRSHEPLVGGKAARLGTLADAGHPIAPGFCVTIRAYELFLGEAQLESLIRMELERKRFEDMRWEEVWDTLRVHCSAGLLENGQVKINLFFAASPVIQATALDLTVFHALCATMDTPPSRTLIPPIT